MLARRFGIVLVLITLFGMGLSSLVASAERPVAQLPGVHACHADLALFCPAPSFAAFR